MKNIFQGNILIRKCIADSLGYNFDESKEEFKFLWFTKDIYLAAFFYLTNRFGSPINYDDYKTAGTWNFLVKDFTIQITFRSTDLEIIVFGEKWHNHGGLTKYQVKRQRLEHKNSHKLLHLDFNKNKIIWDENHVNSEDVRKELESNDNVMDWIFEYNNKASGVNGLEINNIPYQNTYIRRALKTLSQFLHNMLTPIWIRDCSYNIKGRCETEFEKYNNNINIHFENGKNGNVCEERTLIDVCDSQQPGRQGNIKTVTTENVE